MTLVQNRCVHELSSFTEKGSRVGRLPLLMSGFHVFHLGCLTLLSFLSGPLFIEFFGRGENVSCILLHISISCDVCPVGNGFTASLTGPIHSNWQMQIPGISLCHVAFVRISFFNHSISTSSPHSQTSVKFPATYFGLLSSDCRA